MSRQENPQTPGLPCVPTRWWGPAENVSEEESDILRSQRLSDGWVVRTDGKRGGRTEACDLAGATLQASE